MCGVLNATVERASELASPDEVGRTCVLCGFTIKSSQAVHRSTDGEAVHKTCFDELDTEDAHFAERVIKDLRNEADIDAESAYQSKQDSYEQAIRI